MERLKSLIHMNILSKSLTYPLLMRLTYLKYPNLNAKIN